jgi:uridylate kinase
MRSIVISMGGSVILSDDIDKCYFEKLKKLLNNYTNTFKIYLVIGGGKIARYFINLGRDLNFSEERLDEFGISITRINAKFLAYTLGIANLDIAKTTDEAIEVNSSVVVMGGTTPGHSTDMVGAELAKKTGSEKLIIATNVNGVYDKDPNKYPNAKMYEEIHISGLIKEYGTDWKSAGKNTVIDGPALEIISKSDFDTFVINGKNLDQLELILNDKRFNGTKILK